jgi:copper resistance protein C
MPAISFRRLLSVVFCLVLLVLPAATAFAHDTTVVHSNPADGATLAASPSTVTAQFSEELETKGSTMVVLDAGGKQVSDGDGKVDLNDANHATMLASLPSALPAGAYTVKWHALLTDGDASDGSFKFTVAGTGAAAQSAPTAAATLAAGAPTATSLVEQSPATAPTATAAALPAAAQAPPPAAPPAEAQSAAPQLPAAGQGPGLGVLLAVILLALAALLFYVFRGRRSVGPS